MMMLSAPMMMLVAIVVMLVSLDDRPDGERSEPPSVAPPVRARAGSTV
jgi:hypothetical protein